MAVLRTINFLPQNRVDASTFDWQNAMSENIQELKSPGWPEPERSKFKAKSYQEILDDMIHTMKTQLPQNINLNPGSVMLSFIEVVAMQIAQTQEQMGHLMNMYQGASQSSYPTYTYPDGSKSHTKPNDGAVYRYISNHSGAPREECYMYDGMLDSWKWIGAKILVVGGIDRIDIKIDMKDLKVGERKCECGSEKVGSPIHSSWCEKYTK